MNRILNTGLIALLFGLVTACENEIDNYEAPNGGVYGSIYDKETHEPIPMPVAGSSGVMISLGIIGFYIGKIYEEVRRRPRYLISRMTASEKTQEEERF